MQRDSIQRRLIATVVLSQAILTIGLMVTGVLATYWRLLATLDTAMQAHATSVAVLVRYADDGTGNVYFDNSLLPESIDPNHPDQFKVWADRTGFLARSEDWPDGLPRSIPDQTSTGISPRPVCPTMPCEFQHVPILDREEGKAFRPQTLTIVYASPTIRIRQQVRSRGRIYSAGEPAAAGCNRMAGAVADSPGIGIHCKPWRSKRPGFRHKAGGFSLPRKLKRLRNCAL